LRWKNSQRIIQAKYGFLLLRASEKHFILEARNAQNFLLANDELQMSILREQ
jgi:hypothetical protein